MATSPHGIILTDQLDVPWEEGRGRIREQFEQLYALLRARADETTEIVGSVLFDAVTGDGTIASRYISNTGTDNAPKWATVNLENGTNGSLSLAKLADIAASTVLLRRSTGTGDPEAGTLGTGLSISAGAVLDTTSYSKPYFVRKTSDESLTSDTALQNDDVLLFPVAANEIWEFHISVFYTAAADAANGQLKLAITIPTAATMSYGAMGIDGTGITRTGTFRTSVMTTSGSATGQFGGAGASPLEVKIDGIVMNGANAGNVTLQWAQQVSFGTATIVKAGSYLKATRVG